MRFKIKNKKRFILVVSAAGVLFSAGIILGLNGYFGGGGTIPEDTFTRGLVGYWSMDEGSGQYAYDGSGNNNNGTLGSSTSSDSADPKWSSGKAGQAMQFDGVDDYVSVPAAASLSPTTFTIEFWVKPYTIPQSKGIFSGRNGGAGGNDLDININTNWLRVTIAGYMHVFTSSNFILSANNLYHYAVTKDSASLYISYVNGIKDQSNTLVRTLIWSDYLIGKSSYGTIDGLIDDVRIYNRALSAEEVRYHYNRGGPVAHWKFDEGSGQTAFDLTENNNDGRLGSTTAADAADPTWTTGKYGSALNFDGVDDYVSIPAVGLLHIDNLREMWTVEAWFKLNSLTGVQAIAEKHHPFDLRVNNGQFEGRVQVSTGWQSVLGSTLITGTWYHGTITWVSSTQTLSLYLNGKLDNSSSSLGIINSATNMNIGIGNSGYDPPSGANFFNGLIDDVRIYNYARTPDEIRLDYNAGFAAHFGPSSSCDDDPGACMTNGLVGYWNLNEGSGNTAYDGSGNGNNAIGAFSPFTCGASVTFTYKGSSVTYGTVSHNSECWLDRNLGASQVATAYNDSQAYGDLFQWGRLDDGHQTRTSGTTTATSSSDNPGHSNFIYGMGDPYDWRSPKNDNLWQGVSGTNNPCPSGWRIPTETEWETERLSWSSNNYNGAYASPLKLTAGGYRETGLASLLYVGSYGRYWSSALSGIFARRLGFNGADASMASGGRAYGYSVRCVKDDTSGSFWTTGKVGGALQFDGVNDYVNVADNDAFSFGNGSTDNPFSISAWIKLNDADNSEIVEKYTTGNREYFFGVVNTDQLQAVLTDQSTNGYLQSAYTTSLTSYEGQWIHTAMTYDGSATSTGIKIYLNGVQVDNYHYATSYTAMENLTAPLRIGYGQAWGFMDGSVDEVRIYNRALSTTEIRYHYNRGGPVGYWKFDEGSGATAYDSTDNNNDGTLSGGMATSTAENSGWKAGKYGTALSFDGVDDYVEISNNVLGDSINGPFTISAWINWQGTGYDTIVAVIKQSGYDYFDYLGVYEGNVVWWTLLERKRTTDTPISVGKWYHIVITEGSGGTPVKIYINGIEDTTKTDQTGDTTPNVNNTTLIGRQKTADVSNNFQGIIDEVRIYNYVRTPDEIRLDYNAGFAALFGPQSSCDDDPGACMTNGLVGHWSMDEGNGTTTRDGSGNNNNGTLTNGPQWAKGKVGGALQFDGVDDYVDIPDSSSIDITGAITLAVWFKTNSLTSGQAILRKGNPASSPVNYALTYEGAGGDFIRFNFYNGAFQNHDTSWTVSDTNWHHIAVTFNEATDQINFYIDGVADANNPQTEASTMLVNNNPLYITNTTSPVNGLIDEVRIYNRALSATEVRYHYNRGEPVAHWKFNEGEGQTAFDETWNNNDGRLGSTTAADAGDPTWVAGKYGSALSFDGTNDYVNIPNSSSLKPDYFTIEAWIKPPINLDGNIFLSKYSAVPCEYELAIGWSAGSCSYKLFVRSDTTSDTYYACDSVVYTTYSGWIHVVGTYDTDKKLRLYVNGTLKGISAAFTRNTSRTDSLNIGRRPYIGAEGWYRGFIDDVRIYNYARTPAQILQDYNAGLSTHFK